MLYISTGYRVLSIVCLDQLKGARHTHISYRYNCIEGGQNDVSLLEGTHLKNKKKHLRVKLKW